jgi:hypothetical protein
MMGWYKWRAGNFGTASGEWQPNDYLNHWGNGVHATQNIFGGGFEGTTNFYISPAGGDSQAVSDQAGIFMYSQGTETGGIHNGSTTGQYNCLVRMDHMLDGEVTQSVPFHKAEWQHICVRFIDADGNEEVVLTINGENVGGAEAPGNHESPHGDHKVIWGALRADAGHMNGRMNQFAYWDTFLTDAEVENIYNEQKRRYLGHGKYRRMGEEF